MNRAAQDIARAVIKHKRSKLAVVHKSNQWSEFCDPGGYGQPGRQDIARKPLRICIWRAGCQYGIPYETTTSPQRQRLRMRIEVPRETERFGALSLYGVQKVYELDSGMGAFARPEDEESTVRRLAYEDLSDISRDMAIVVPVRGERLKLVEGVLVGIPNDCLTIVVSNSAREPVDRFQMEFDAVRQYADVSKKKMIIVHQKDPALAEAFRAGGYPHLLDEETGLISDGKAEGMLAGKLLARLCGKQYIGFVDSDNYFPGAVYEYVRLYAAGFAMSNSNYSMVRIAWHSKPKIKKSELFFAKWGRSSVITNRILNSLISDYTGFDTEVIKTGNAGEHAMTMDLAMLLDYSKGYSIEPQHFMSLLEKFGGVRPSPYPDVMKQQIEIYQLESRNPHMHESKGDEHIQSMVEQALQVIYHSFVCPESVKREIERELETKDVGVPTYYPALINVNLDAFREALEDRPYAQLFAAARYLNAGDIPAAPHQTVASVGHG